MAGMGFGSLVMPKLPFGTRMIDVSQALNAGMDVAIKKQLADAAMTVAKSKGASYADVRIGRYLNQFIVTRENRIQNIVNTESFGVGIRVIANGSWGFAAGNDRHMSEFARHAAPDPRTAINFAADHEADADAGSRTHEHEVRH